MGASDCYFHPQPHMVLTAALRCRNPQPPRPERLPSESGQRAVYLCSVAGWPRRFCRPAGELCTSRLRGVTLGRKKASLVSETFRERSIPRRRAAAALANHAERL